MDKQSSSAIDSSSSHVHGRINPLPPNVVAEIKSSIAITTLNRVVLGLVENSLDAGATRIDVQVDQGRAGCVIEDNGLGIHPAEFVVAAGLAKMHRQLKIPLIG
jgi:DNA mismatch repair protein MLH3